jgi:hypothetical protein
MKLIVFGHINLMIFKSYHELGKTSSLFFSNQNKIFDCLLFFYSRCFGFVSKKTNGTKSSQPENECHIFAEIDPSQPSSAIVNFVSKIMIGSVPV